MHSTDGSPNSPDAASPTVVARRSPPSSRLPALAPLQTPGGLAPLEYLQLNQRRGSITDPSLHASASAAGSLAIAHPTHIQNQTQHQNQDHSSSATSPRHSFSPATTNGNSSSSAPSPFAPRSSFSFPSSTKLVVTDHHHHQQQHPMDRPWSAPNNGPGPHDAMDTDDRSPGPDHTRSSNGQPPSFLSSPRSALSGTKRKMSHDSPRFRIDDDPNGKQPSNFATGAFGPTPAENEGPLPKRRGSAFDTQRIAHLSLQDRRDSMDSRSSISGASIGGGWAADRRDSAASMYSTTSIGSNHSGGGYSTASGGDQTAKPYAWPPHPHSHSSNTQEPDHHGFTSRPYAFPSDPNPPPHSYHHAPNGLPPAPPIPSVHFSASVAAARRLSVPDVNIPLNGARTRTRGSSSASLREQVKAELAMNTSQPDSDSQSPQQMDSDGGQGQLASPAYLNGMLPPQPGQPGSKETPYSRSPELRVSHKLAERKRRKEMKELFDELRDQLPADRGMKASKWEILSKAVDYIAQLKVAYTTMSDEIERLRHDAETFRPGQQTPFQQPLSSGNNGQVSGPGPITLPVVSVSNPTQSHDTPATPTRPLPPGYRPSSAQSFINGNTNGVPKNDAPQPDSRPGSAGESTFHRHTAHLNGQTPTPQQASQPLPSK